MQLPLSVCVVLLPAHCKLSFKVYCMSLSHLPILKFMLPSLFTRENMFFVSTTLFKKYLTIPLLNCKSSKPLRVNCLMPHNIWLNSMNSDLLTFGFIASFHDLKVDRFKLFLNTVCVTFSEVDYFQKSDR